MDFLSHHETVAIIVGLVYSVAKLAWIPINAVQCVYSGTDTKLAEALHRTTTTTVHRSTPIFIG